MLLFTSLLNTAGGLPGGGGGGGAGSIALVNGGFETGDFTGWTLVSGSGWQVASAGTTANSDPRTGSFYARVSGNTAGVARRQTFDLLASGFTDGEIDAGILTLSFTGWIGGEDGVNDGGRIRVNYLDGSMTLIDTTETSTTITTAGVYMQHTVSENIPAGTRHLQLDFILRGNAGGSTLPFADDFSASIDYPS